MIFKLLILSIILIIFQLHRCLNAGCVRKMSNLSEIRLYYECSENINFENFEKDIKALMRKYKFHLLEIELSDLKFRVRDNCISNTRSKSK
jgi:hypothetical protein